MFCYAEISLYLQVKTSKNLFTECVLLLYLYLHLLYLLCLLLGYAVAQFVGALRYMPEGCGSDSRLCH